MYFPSPSDATNTFMPQPFIGLPMEAGIESIGLGPVDLLLGGGWKLGGKYIFGKGSLKTFGGRLGNETTRNQIYNIGNQLKQRGYTITGGGQRRAEEYLRPLSGGRKGGSYIDITATHPNYPTLRINTVDVLKDGVTPTTRELRNAK